jgi:small subunit ribosomal protein S21
MPVNIRIKVRKGEDIQRALKRYKNKYSEFGIREELMDRKTFTKPTTAKRKQKMDAIRANTRLVEEQKQEDGIR